MSTFPRILRFYYFAGASRFLHSAPRAVAATGCVAVVTLLLHTGALAQTDPYLDKIQKQQENYCAISGNCNEPNRSNSGGGPNGEVSKWTAIAVSDSNLAYGASWQANSRREAEQIALEYCRGQGASDCKVQMWAQGKCVALATSGSDVIWGTDSGLYPGTAQAGALAQCRKFGGHACAIVTHPCSQDPS